MSLRIYSEAWHKEQLVTVEAGLDHGSTRKKVAPGVDEKFR